MREILFRGKQLQTNNWVYGDLLQWKHFNGKSFTKQFAINAQGLDAGQSLIIPETIGQYTGVKDKNSKMIFEGDIVKATWGYSGEVDYENFIYYKVEGRIDDDIEIIGNIHDNPELRTNPK